MGTRKEQALRTHGKIVNAGIELISRHGFDEVTVDDICGACGIAKGTFYYYFKSKDELVDAIERRAHGRIASEITAATGVGVCERLRLFVDLWAGTALDLGMGCSRQLLKHDLGPGYVATAPDSPPVFLDHAVREILEEAVESGELRPDTPVDSLVKLYMSDLYGSVACWCMFEGGFVLSEWASEFSEFVERRVLSSFLSAGERGVH